MIAADVALAEALGKAFTGFTVSVDRHDSIGWASATFTGARHEIGLHISGAGAWEAAERFAAALDVHEFDLRGHILADIALVSISVAIGGVGLAIEALTVEDC